MYGQWKTGKVCFFHVLPCVACAIWVYNIIFPRCKNGLENLLRIMYSVVKKLILSGHLSIVATKGKASVVRHLIQGMLYYAIVSVTMCCNKIARQVAQNIGCRIGEGDNMSAHWRLHEMLSLIVVPPLLMDIISLLIFWNCLFVNFFSVQQHVSHNV